MTLVKSSQAEAGGSGDRADWGRDLPGHGIGHEAWAAGQKEWEQHGEAAWAAHGAALARLHPQPVDDSGMTHQPHFPTPLSRLGQYAGRTLHAEGQWAQPAKWERPSYGAVVFNKQGHVLLRRPTKEFGGAAWTFPKGARDEGESTGQAATREVLEETGYRPTLTDHLPGPGYKGSTGRTWYYLAQQGDDSPAWDRMTAEENGETEALTWAKPEDAYKLMDQSTHPVRFRDQQVLRDAVARWSQSHPGQPVPNLPEPKPIPPPPPLPKWTPSKAAGKWGKWEEPSSGPAKWTNAKPVSSKVQSMLDALGFGKKKSKPPIDPTDPTGTRSDGDGVEVRMDWGRDLHPGVESVADKAAHISAAQWQAGQTEWVQHGEAAWERKGEAVRLAGRNPQPLTVKTNDPRQAVEALANGHYVQLSHKRHVATLVHHLANLVKSGENPNIDLCKVSVKHTNVFCETSHGIPRSLMPQLRGFAQPGSPADALEKDDKGKVDLGPLFVQHLRDKGVGVSTDVEGARYLHASQGEIDGAKAARMGTSTTKKLGKGTFNPRPIVVSRDNYIVDGHHHWAGAIAHGLGNKTDVQLPVQRVNMDILPLLAEADNFSRYYGVGAEPLHTREDWGRDLLHGGETIGQKAAQIASTQWISQPKWQEGQQIWAKSGEAAWMGHERAFDALHPAAQSHVSAIAHGAVQRAAVSHAEVGPMLQGLAGQHGGSMIGLEHAVKTPTSLSDKITEKMAEAHAHGAQMNPDEALGAIHDVHRYTMQFSPENYTSGVLGAVRTLQRQGYSFPEDRIKNTWDPANVYRGLNTTMKSPHGESIEMQFHTPDSFATKEAMHEDYEAQRQPGTTEAQRMVLADRMRERSANLAMPPGASTLTRDVLSHAWFDSTVRGTISLEVRDGRLGSRPEVLRGAARAGSAVALPGAPHALDGPRHEHGAPDLAAPHVAEGRREDAGGLDRGRDQPGEGFGPDAGVGVEGSGLRADWGKDLDHTGSSAAPIASAEWAADAGWHPNSEAQAKEWGKAWGHAWGAAAKKYAEDHGDMAAATQWATHQAKWNNARPSVDQSLKALGKAAGEGGTFPMHLHANYAEGAHQGYMLGSANDTLDSVQISAKAAPWYAAAKKYKAAGDLNGWASSLGSAHGIKEASRDKAAFEKAQGTTPHAKVAGGKGLKVVKPSEALAMPKVEEPKPEVGIHVDTNQFTEALHQAVDSMHHAVASMHAVASAATAAPEPEVHEPEPTEPVHEEMPSTLSGLDSWEKISGPHGSNPSQWYKAPSGQQYLLKQASNPDMAENEVAMGKVYEAAGLPVPHTRIVTGDDGSKYVLSRKVESPTNGIALKPWQQTYANEGEARKGYGVDTLTANWDVGGLVKDNVMTDQSGHVVRVDLGGAGKYRAQGSPKPTWGVGKEVTEHESLLQPGAQGAWLYGGSYSTDPDMQESLKAAAHLDLTDVHQRMLDAGVSPEHAEESTNVLKDRQGQLKAIVGEPEHPMGTTPGPSYEDGYQVGKTMLENGHTPLQVHTEADNVHQGALGQHFEPYAMGMHQAAADHHEAVPSETPVIETSAPVPNGDVHAGPLFAKIPEKLPDAVTPNQGHQYEQGLQSGYLEAKTSGLTKPQLKAAITNKGFKKAAAAKASGDLGQHAYYYGFAHGYAQAHKEHTGATVIPSSAVATPEEPKPELPGEPAGTTWHYTGTPMPHLQAVKYEKLSTGKLEYTMSSGEKGTITPTALGGEQGITNSPDWHKLAPGMVNEGAFLHQDETQDAAHELGYNDGAAMLKDGMTAPQVHYHAEQFVNNPSYKAGMHKAADEAIGLNEEPPQWAPPVPPPSGAPVGTKWVHSNGGYWEKMPDGTIIGHDADGTAHPTHTWPNYAESTLSDALPKTEPGEAPKVATSEAKPTYKVQKLAKHLKVGDIVHGPLAYQNGDLGSDDEPVKLAVVKPKDKDGDIPIQYETPDGYLSGTTYFKANAHVTVHNATEPAAPEQTVEHASVYELQHALGKYPDAIPSGAVTEEGGTGKEAELHAYASGYLYGSSNAPLSFEDKKKLVTAHNKAINSDKHVTAANIRGVLDAQPKPVSDVDPESFTMPPEVPAPDRSKLTPEQKAKYDEWLANAKENLKNTVVENAKANALKDPEGFQATPEKVIQHAYGSAHWYENQYHNGDLANSNYWESSVASLARADAALSYGAHSLYDEDGKAEKTVADLKKGDEIAPGIKVFAAKALGTKWSGNKVLTIKSDLGKSEHKVSGYYPVSMLAAEHGYKAAPQLPALKEAPLTETKLDQKAQLFKAHQPNTLTGWNTNKKNYYHYIQAFGEGKDYGEGLSDDALDAEIEKAQNQQGAAYPKWTSIAEVQNNGHWHGLKQVLADRQHEKVLIAQAHQYDGDVHYNPPGGYDAETETAKAYKAGYATGKNTANNLTNDDLDKYAESTADAAAQNEDGGPKDAKKLGEMHGAQQVKMQKDEFETAAAPYKDATGFPANMGGTWEQKMAYIQGFGEAHKLAHEPTADLNELATQAQTESYQAGYGSLEKTKANGKLAAIKGVQKDIDQHDQLVNAGKAHSADPEYQPPAFHPDDYAIGYGKAKAATLTGTDPDKIINDAGDKVVSAEQESQEMAHQLGRMKGAMAGKRVLGELETAKAQFAHEEAFNPQIVGTDPVKQMSYIAGYKEAHDAGMAGADLDVQKAKYDKDWATTPGGSAAEAMAKGGQNATAQVKKDYGEKLANLAAAEELKNEPEFHLPLENQDEYKVGYVKGKAAGVLEDTGADYLAHAADQVTSLTPHTPEYATALGNMHGAQSGQKLIAAAEEFKKDAAYKPPPGIKVDYNQGYGEGKAAVSAMTPEEGLAYKKAHFKEYQAAEVGSKKEAIELGHLHGANQSLTAMGVSPQAISGSAQVADVEQAFSEAHHLKNLGLKEQLPERPDMSEEELMKLDAYRVAHQSAVQDAKSMDPDQRKQASDEAMQHLAQSISPSAQAAAMGAAHGYQYVAPSEEPPAPVEDAEEAAIQTNPETLPEYADALKAAQDEAAAGAHSKALYEKAGKFGELDTPADQARAMAYNLVAEQVDLAENELPQPEITEGHEPLTDAQKEYMKKAATEGQGLPMSNATGLHVWAYDQGRAVGHQIGSIAQEGGLQAADLEHAALAEEQLAKDTTGLISSKHYGAARMLHRMALAMETGTGSITTNASALSPKPDVSYHSPAKMLVERGHKGVHLFGEAHEEAEWTPDEVSAFNMFTGPFRFQEGKPHPGAGASHGLTSHDFYAVLNAKLGGMETAKPDPVHKNSAYYAEQFLNACNYKSVPSKMAIYRGTQGDEWKPGEFDAIQKAVQAGGTATFSLPISSCTYNPEVGIYKNKPVHYFIDQGALTMDGTYKHGAGEGETNTGGLMEIYKVQKMGTKTVVYMRQKVHYVV